MHRRICTVAVFIADKTYSPIRMAEIKTTDKEKTKCWWVCPHCWWENEVVPSLWRSVWWQLLSKANICLPYDPVIPLLSVYPRETKTCPHRSPNSRFIRNCPTWKRPTVFRLVNGCKVAVVYLHYGPSLRNEKEPTTDTRNEEDESPMHCRGAEASSCMTFGILEKAKYWNKRQISDCRQGLRVSEGAWPQSFTGEIFGVRHCSTSWLWEHSCVCLLHYKEPYT